MSDPRWENVREDWLPNDGLRDVFIADDTEEDWRKVASWIMSRPEWSTTYTEDGEHVDMPDVAEVMLRSADVSVLYGRNDVQIEVRDDGTGSSTSDGLGHGLVGIRERVKIYGGEMTAGAAAEGGFLLSTRLPLDAVRS